MAVTRKHLDTGLFTFRRVTEEEPKQIIMMETLPQRSLFEGSVTSLEAHCEDILRKAGSPPWQKEDRLRPWLGEDPLPLDGKSRWTDDLPVNSEEWYAANILDRIDSIRFRLMVKDDASAIASLAMSLGMFTMIAVVKFTWEQDAVRGKLAKQGASKGGTGRAAARREKWLQTWTEWQKEADEIWHAHPTTSTSDVARRVGQKHGVSFHTVRGRIHRRKS